MTQRLLMLLSRTEVWMGVESGSQEVLDAMDKGTRLWQVHEARENLRRHGIRACYFLQFGYPGETFEDMIFTTLTRDGHIACPECGDPVAVSEESLGRLALSMLSQL